jgi:flagella basal body P-ring formation protein FlgA
MNARTTISASTPPPWDRIRSTARIGLAVLTLAAAFGFAVSPSYAAQPVALKSQIEASGPALTLSDVFIDAGSAGARAVAPAPLPGQSANVSARFLVAAAAAAGLDWTPPSGMDQVTVSRRPRAAGAPRSEYAQLTATASLASARIQSASGPESVISDALIHRGDTVTLVYIAPGLQLTTRAKALNDAAIGGAVRLVNLQSNRAVDAVVTGPATASASPGPSF